MNTIYNDYGEVAISDAVISELASQIALAQEGVRQMDSRYSHGLYKAISDGEKEGVHISSKSDGIVVDLYIIVQYGFRIPDIALKLQDKERELLSQLTGISVAAVNITVEGIVFD